MGEQANHTSPGMCSICRPSTQGVMQSRAFTDVSTSSIQAGRPDVCLSPSRLARGGSLACFGTNMLKISTVACTCFSSILHHLRAMHRQGVHCQHAGRASAALTPRPAVLALSGHVRLGRHTGSLSGRPPRRRQLAPVRKSSSTFHQRRTQR